MASTSSRHAEERAALDAVLASPTFARATRLSQFLRYICEQSFDGRADDLKEYTIAVEAFGRSEEFDHAKDSIVRVEALRLRKKLAAFYEDEGADHPLKIRVPSGGYVPIFDRAAPEVAAEEPGRSRRRLWLGATAAALLTAAVFTPALITRVPESNEAVATIAEDQADLRIMARTRGVFVDPMGVLWTGALGSGGELVEIDRPDSAPRHYGLSRIGDFSYEIPLEPGVYEVALHFVEPRFDRSARDRRFRVRLDERVLLDDYNVLEDSPDESRKAIRVFGDISPAEDGVLRVQFESIREGALFTGMELLATDGSGARPVRIVAGRQDYLRDADGRLWQPDRHVAGGTAVSRPKPVAGAEFPGLFGGERWGNFQYAIPVAEGSYELRLYFAETWFGPSNHGGGKAGARLFDVYCNGWPLLETFDLYEAAGGENRAFSRTFEGLRPGPDGRIVLEFRGENNFAMVNAIELVREQPETSLTRQLKSRNGG